ncbi:efflux RND transporter periplasmic adaptor subunit [Sphingomonas sp. 1P06PA]|uniref:efflux RND transporter periplasmic adaptor subunit n=1 Tax=Sphingomonas sp. 1P06PA TaxID=554121 RepID=UPI0039A5959F
MKPAIPVIALSLLLVGCGGGEAKQRERPAPLVTAVQAKPVRFVDRIEAIGTARANEQVTLSAPVTERLVRVNFNDGGYVAAGQVVATLAQSQENATLAEAQANARVAGQQLARISELKQRGFATNASLDTQIAAASAARAQAEQARATIADRVIRAPFGGYVSLRTISPGAVVQAGTEIATISDISVIKLDFPVPETLLSAIRQGQTIDARAAAFPDQPVRGTIETIDTVVDPATRSVLVRAVLPNPDRLLKPGMLLTVAIEARPRTALAVPELAVVGEGDQRYVFRIGAGDKVTRAPVKVGVRQNGLLEISEGLAAGQKIVGEGVVKVADGMTVKLAGPRPPANAQAAR